MNRADDEVNERLAQAAIEGRKGKPTCDHGVTFDEAEYDAFCSRCRDAYAQVALIHKNWPRLDGACPKGCGYVGIAYASYRHYIAGDW